jgi:hypothetical protein
MRLNWEARNAPQTPGRATRTAQVVSELDHQGFFWRRHWRRCQAASARGVSLASKPSFASWLMRRLALTSFERRSK